MKTIIVTGGRNFGNRIGDMTTVLKVLDWLDPDHVVEGGASGADRTAQQWAKAHDKKCTTVKADWKTHGLRAGPLRNFKMIQDHFTAVIVAFPGGKGTENCVKTALEWNRIVLRVEKL